MMTNKDISQVEKFPSPPNLPPGDTLLGKFLFLLRRIFDFQVATVLYYFAPKLSKLKGKTLEVGCGAQPYRHFVSKECEYQGLDWKGAKEHFQYEAKDTVYYEGGKFPFDDETFDNVFHTEVLEHIWNYEGFIAECYRTLKTGGNLFFSVPFQARYHYIPNDFWRFTPSAITKLLEDAGFKDVKIHTRGTDISVACYKVISVVYRWAKGNLFQKILSLFFIPTLTLLIPIAHIAFRFELGSKDDCLGYNVEAYK